MKACASGCCSGGGGGVDGCGSSWAAGCKGGEDDGGGGNGGCTGGGGGNGGCTSGTHCCPVAACSGCGGGGGGCCVVAHAAAGTLGVGPPGSGGNAEMPRVSILRQNTPNARAACDLERSTAAGGMDGSLTAPPCSFASLGTSRSVAVAGPSEAAEEEIGCPELERTDGSAMSSMTDGEPRSLSESQADGRAETESASEPWLSPADSRPSPESLIGSNDTPKGCEGPLAAALACFASGGGLPPVALLKHAALGAPEVEVAMPS